MFLHCYKFLLLLFSFVLRIPVICIEAKLLSFENANLQEGTTPEDDRNNPAPADRKEIGVTVYLYTRQRDGISIKTQTPTLEDGVLDCSKKTKFIIHGFRSSGNASWVQEMKSSLLAKDDVNVFAVDWSNGNGPWYYKAAANTRTVASELADFLQFLKDRCSLKYDDVHIIGHSLGAHVSGFTGKQVQGVGRITGLDPAHPKFSDRNHTDRLDYRDAEFVDVIHSNANSNPIVLNGWGMMEAIGHLDFYPNGGSDQPGCQITDIPSSLLTEGILKTGQDAISCSHARAIKLFIESINTKCKFISFECESYEQFARGKCLSCGRNRTHCAILGYDADKYPSRMRRKVPLYLTTSADYPHCENLYGVKIRMGVNPEDKTRSHEGTAKISLIGPKRAAHDLILNDDKWRSSLIGVGSPLLFRRENLIFKQGDNLTTLTYNGGSLVENISRVLFSWDQRSRSIVRGSLHAVSCTIRGCSRTVYLQHVVIENLSALPQKLERTILCPPEGESYVEAKEGSSVALTSHTCTAEQRNLLENEEQQEFVASVDTYILEKETVSNNSSTGDSLTASDSGFYEYEINIMFPEGAEKTKSFTKVTLVGDKGVIRNMPLIIKSNDGISWGNQNLTQEDSITLYGNHTENIGNITIAELTWHQSALGRVCVLSCHNFATVRDVSVFTSTGDRYTLCPENGASSLKIHHDKFGIFKSEACSANQDTEISYEVDIQLAPSKVFPREQTGYVWMTLYGTRGTTSRMGLTARAHVFTPGSSVTLAGRHEKNVGDVTQAELEWKKKFFPCFLLCDRRLFVENIQIRTRSARYKLCPPGDAKYLIINNGDSHMFHSDTCVN